MSQRIGADAPLTHMPILSDPVLMRRKPREPEFGN
jgi:hypothetical protein